MIDMHSHILYGIDDGAKSIDETLDMIEIAVSEGIQTIVATPHYIVGENQYSKEHLLTVYNEVLVKIKEYNFPIKLLLGNELFVDSMLPEKLEEGQCFTLGNSDYVLIEFANNTKINIIYNMIYQLKLKGYMPIIAHPERSFLLKKDLNTLIELIERGCLLQINANSITGLYGDTIRKSALEMLARNIVHIISTDAHTSNRRSPRLKKAYEMVKYMYSEAYAELLFRENALKILNNEHIQLLLKQA